MAHLRGIGNGLMAPTLTHEHSLGGLVAGIDEAGRGPWAGPVVAAAVVFSSSYIPSGIDDSKKLPHAKREALFDTIIDVAETGIGTASVEEIDSLNIWGATKLAMQRAVAALPCLPSHALVDGNRSPDLLIPTTTLVKGDSLSLSIAAASILAKVTRDRLMCALAQEFPHYGWEKNAGYGTALHQQGLAKHGVTAHHRRSYKPIQHYLAHAA